eukprot:CAMPEP_0202349112 /NCGR_PEP_ID=MMETSP1126-20121109/6743_1 /ASSEMBLY_ACC=CAM_ASM_000457 /TAXON_ID=3047 /ORGANISM="Dunaliella tertiolecta, Strain CCMP1320" /LENGTH=378 /DNA_ID=CAMNT_0048940875 /DNA_START=86 /DNA_END=1222 /DNA_ORIENTATION=+
MKMFLAVLLALSCCHLSAASGSQKDAHDIFFFDSRDGTYLRGKQQKGISTALDGGSVLAVLIGAIPPHAVSAAGSEELSKIVKPSPFKKPRAHAAFTVAGLSADEFSIQNGAFLPGRNEPVHLQVPLKDDPAEQLLQTYTQLAAANPSVRMLQLEGASNKVCDKKRKEQVHAMAASVFGADRGSSVLPLSGGSSLDLDALSCPIFAAELAALHSGIAQFAQQPTSDGKELHVLEMTFLGLQEVQARHGPESHLASLSKQALMRALGWAVQQLDASMHGDVTIQVATIKALPIDSGNSGAMSEWKATRRARILQAAGTPEEKGPWYKNDEAAQSQLFAAKAAGYGSFILVLYFLLGATLCLCNMRSKKDTLLYGNKKSD